MTQYKTSLPWGDDAETHYITFSYYAGTPPVYYGDAPYPGDPPELEILDVQYPKGVPIELGLDEEEALTNYLFEHLDEHLPEEPDYDYNFKD